MTVNLTFFRVSACLVVCIFCSHALLAKPSAKKPVQKTPVVDENPEPLPLPQADPKPAAKPSPSAKLQSESARPASAAPNATISSDALIEFHGASPRVRKLIEAALALTAQDLTYTYGSADPANGGMDCSGFVYYLLQKNGITDVPRDASGQYVWLRKAGAFRAVLSRKVESFELNELRPGDLLFWAGTYSTDRDPPITHAMIYLGTEKESKSRVMVGASNGRSYHGRSRWGVSVFDFTMPKVDPDHPQKRVDFVGYAHIPAFDTNAEAEAASESTKVSAADQTTELKRKKSEEAPDKRSKGTRSKTPG